MGKVKEYLRNLKQGVEMIWGISIDNAITGSNRDFIYIHFKTCRNYFPWYFYWETYPG